MRVRPLLVTTAVVTACVIPVSNVDARRRPRIEVPSQVVVSDVTPSGFAYGVVDASRPVCADGRKVSVTRNGTALAATQTDSSGDWSTTSAGPSNGDRYTAEIERERIRVGNRIYICGSDFDSFVFGR